MTKPELSKEDKKYLDNQKFIGIISGLGLSVHRIKNQNLTRIEVMGVQYNQKQLHTITYLCLEDEDIDKLISLLQKSKDA